MRIVDCTPTWRGLLPALVYCAINGETPEARQGAMKELERLADIGDQAVAAEKAKAKG